MEKVLRRQENVFKPLHRGLLAAVVAALAMAPKPTDGMPFGKGMLRNDVREVFLKDDNVIPVAQLSFRPAGSPFFVQIPELLAPAPNIIVLVQNRECQVIAGFMDVVNIALTVSIPLGVPLDSIPWNGIKVGKVEIKCHCAQPNIE